MSFADEMKDLASSVPKPGKEYWDNYAVKKIYENVKAEIQFRARNGELSGTIMCCFWQASPVQREFETELVFSKYNLDGYVMGSKFCVKIISKKGFFSNTMLFECTPGGKIVLEYISKEDRKDGISVSYCANLDGIEYEIGIPVKRKDVFDEVRYSDLYVRYKI